MSLKIVSLYAGVGGLDYGFNKLGADFVFISEFNKNAAETYRKNNPTHAHVLSEEDIGIAREKVPEHDVLIGGISCQAWSMAGKRLGFNDKRGMEWFNLFYILEKRKPKYFVIENVKGLLSHDDGNSFRFILEEFYKLGYNVTYDLVNMSEWGVPQRRERVIIRGSLDFLPIHLPSPKLKPITLKEVVDSITDEDRKHPNFNIHTGTHKKQRWIKVLRDSENLFKLSDDEIKKRQVDLGMEPIIKPSSILGYRRLDSSKVAPTMMFGNSCIPIHPFEDRSLSVFETAIIQGFPRDFVFTGGSAAQYKQIGNAVPPLFSEKLAEIVINEIETHRLLTS